MIYDEQAQPNLRESKHFAWTDFRINKQKLLEKIPQDSDVMLVVHPGFAKYFPGQLKEITSPEKYAEYVRKRSEFINQGLRLNKILIVFGPVDYLNQTLTELPNIDSAIVIPTKGESTLPDEAILEMTVDDFLGTLKDRVRQVELLGEWKITCVANTEKLLNAYQIPTQVTEIVY